MKKLWFLLTLFVLSVSADSTLLIKKGWQLVGLNADVQNMALFETENVEQVWYFDATGQKWQGFSPDASVQGKIKALHFETISGLKSGHGFWVKSKQAWSLVLKSTPNAEAIDNNISLKTGWNLISLPIDIVVSPDLFKNATLWKYQGDAWQLFDERYQDNNFARMTTIHSGEGIWVKSKTDQMIDISYQSSTLSTFKTTEAMEAAIREMVLAQRRPYWGYYPLEIGSVKGPVATVVANDTATSGPSSNKIDNATGTNLQEVGVDESDIIKHDGERLFFIADASKAKVGITTFERILSGEKTPQAEIALDSDKVASALYLNNNKLIILSSTKGNFATPMVDAIEIGIGYTRSKIAIDIYDVKDIANIPKIAAFEIDGWLHESRVVGSSLLLVSSFTPRIEVNYPKIYVDAPQCREWYAMPVSSDGVTSSADAKRYAPCYGLMMDENNKFYRWDYDHPQIVSENLIPKITQNSFPPVSLLKPQTFYVSKKKNQDPILSTVSKIDLSSMTLVDTSTILGHHDSVYASSDALYLVSSEYPYYYDFTRYQERSTIYKFSIDNNLSYVGKGHVNGRVLNQFSLSEYGNILRIATTEGFSWQNHTTNSVYTLKEDAGKLVQLGFVGSLGHEGETIYAVRFLKREVMW